MNPGGRAAKVVSRLADIRPGEGRAAASLAALFFLVMIAADVLIPLKTATLLDRLGTQKLPLTYLITAALMSLAGALNSRFLQTRSPRRAMLLSLLAFMASALAFPTLLKAGFSWAPIAFWFWSDLFLALSVSQFWLLVTTRFAPRQAKRFVGFFVSAGLLGGIAGSLLAWVGPRIVSAGKLIYACPALLLVCAGILRFWVPGERGRGPDDKAKESREIERPDILGGFRALIRSRYLLALSAFMLAAFAVSRILDFQLSAALRARGMGRDDITSYMGVFMVAYFAASYLVQVLLSGPLLRRFGLRGTVAAAPVVLLVGAAAGWLIPLAGGAWLAWVTVMRGADKTLSFSLSQSTREILFIPVSQAVKLKAKAVIDLFLNKLGDALGAALLLVLGGAADPSPRGLERRVLGLLAVFLLAWLWLGRRVVAQYVGVVSSHLRLRWPDADRAVLDAVDVDATKLVFDTIESRARSSVLYAMNCLDLIDRDKLTPELRAVIAGRSSELQACSLDSLLGIEGGASFPGAEEILDERELGGQAREIMGLDVYQKLMGERVGAVMKTGGDAAEVEQMEIAKAIGMMRPEAPLVRRLPRLLRHPSPEVARYALESAGRLKIREHVPLIVPHLARPATSASAAQALGEYGDAIAGALADHMADPRVASGARRALPAVLGRMGTARAARYLLAAMGGEGGELDAEIAAALFRLKADHPGIESAEAAVRPHLFRIAREAACLIMEMDDLRAGRTESTSVPDPEAAVSARLQILFELFSLVYPRDNVIRAWQNYRQGSRRSMDYALELLEHILPREVREAVLPLLEDLPLEEKARRCRRLVS